MSQSTSASAIESDIRAARSRLENTVNELAYRSQPQVIAQKQTEALKLKMESAVKTDNGDLRTERVAAVAVAAVALVVAAVLLRRRG